MSTLETAFSVLLKSLKFKKCHVRRIISMFQAMSGGGDHFLIKESFLKMSDDDLETGFQENGFNWLRI